MPKSSTAYEIVGILVDLDRFFVQPGEATPPCQRQDLCFFEQVDDHTILFKETEAIM